MTDREIDALYQAAEAEFNQSETAMLVAPVAILGLIDQYRRCERQRAEAGLYDQLAD